MFLKSLFKKEEAALSHLGSRDPQSPSAWGAAAGALTQRQANRIHGNIRIAPTTRHFNTNLRQIRKTDCPEWKKETNKQTNKQGKKKQLKCITTTNISHFVFHNHNLSFPNKRKDDRSDFSCLFYLTFSFWSTFYLPPVALTKLTRFSSISVILCTNFIFSLFIPAFICVS